MARVHCTDCGIRLDDEAFRYPSERCAECRKKNHLAKVYGVCPFCGAKDNVPRGPIPEGCVNCWEVRHRVEEFLKYPTNRVYIRELLHKTAEEALQKVAYRINDVLKIGKITFSSPESPGVENES